MKIANPSLISLMSSNRLAMSGAELCPIVAGIILDVHVRITEVHFSAISFRTNVTTDNRSLKI
jgi:hypothetical protein